MEHLELVDLEPSDPRLIDDALAVLQELRTHLTTEMLTEIYRLGYPQGLRFLAAYRGAECVGVAGWRIVINTGASQKLYIDDLVTRAQDRSAGVGHLLLSELENRGRQMGCSVLDLDSGTQRLDAHRFYFRERMVIRSFHFAKSLGP